MVWSIARRLAQDLSYGIPAEKLGISHGRSSKRTVTTFIACRLRILGPSRSACSSPWRGYFPRTEASLGRRDRPRRCPTAGRSDARVLRAQAAPSSCSRLKSGSMLIADRGYDADLVRTLVRQHRAWANIPSRSNRKEALSFSPYLYRARNLVERFKIKHCRRVATRYDKLAANTLHSSSVRQYGYGCALMSSRPSAQGC